MILDHVPQAAALLVVAAARADADLLGHGDSHAVDEIAVPERLEDRVGETLHEEVLHRLLSRGSGRSENLVFGEDGAEGGVQFAGGPRSLPKGFSMITFECCGVPGMPGGETARPEIQDNRRKDRGRGGM